MFRDIYLQHREVAFAIDRKHALDDKLLAIHQVNFNATRFFNDVAVRDDSIARYTISPAPRKSVAAGIKGFYRHGRRFDPLNEVGQIILRSDPSRQKKR